MYQSQEIGADANGFRSAFQEPQPSTTPTAGGDDEDNLNGSGTLRIGRRRSSVRLIPTNSIDEHVDERQADNLAHSKTQMRRRSSVLMRQQALLQQQQQMALLAQAAGRTGPPQRQPSARGSMRPGQPLPPPQRQALYVRQPARRPSYPPAEMPQQQQQQQQPQQQQAQAPPPPAAPAKEVASPQKKIAPNLSGPPQGSDMKRRASQYRANPAKQQQPQQQPSHTSRVGGSSSAVAQSARRPSVLAEKAKQQSRRRSHSDNSASDAEEEEEKKATTPPPISFTQRLSLFFKPTTTHRRKSKGEAEAEKAKSTKKRKSGAKPTPDSDDGAGGEGGSDANGEKDRKQRNSYTKNRRESRNVTPVQKMSAVEEAPREDPNEKVLEELDSTLAKRERAMSRTKSVRRTQSFFGNFNEHKDDDDDGEGYEYSNNNNNNEEGGDDRHTSSPSSSSTCSTSASPSTSATPENHHRAASSSNSPGWEGESVMDTFKGALTGRNGQQQKNRHSDTDGGNEEDKVSPLPLAGSAEAGSDDDVKEQQYSMSAGGSDSSSTTSSSRSTSSEDDKEKTPEEEARENPRHLDRGLPSGKDYKPSSFFKPETSQTTNGVSPSPPPAKTSASANWQQQQQQHSQQQPQPQQQQQQQMFPPGVTNQWRASSVPYTPAQQQQNVALPAIHQPSDYRRQSVPIPATPSLSPSPQQTVMTPQQIQKRVSMAFPAANSVPNMHGMQRPGVAAGGRPSTQP